MMAGASGSDRAPARAGGAPSERTSGRVAPMRCGRCGRGFDDDAWRALDVVERIDGPRLEAIVTAWPEERAVEVRRCTSCGTAIARTAAR